MNFLAKVFGKYNSRKVYDIDSKSSLTLTFILLCGGLFQAVLSQPYRSHQRCSTRLENALENMRRRSYQTKTGRSYSPPQSPYALYHSLYGQEDDGADDFYRPTANRGYYAKNINRSYGPNSRLDFDAALNTYTSGPPYQYHTQRQPHKLQVARVDVEDLRVRLPSENAARWVEIDKCKFSAENSTLDTRLIFPDLTLSGRVVLQPTGGKCNMILRLRHAGIEFRTVPIGFDKVSGEESRRVGTASVRTDSHFAEPGFISVFAHGCQGPTGIKLRQNSKRRYSFVNENQNEVQGPSLHVTPQSQLTPGIIFDIRSEGYIPPNMRDEDLAWTDANSQELFDPNGDNFYRRQFRSKRSAYGRRQGRHTLSDRLRDEMNFNDDILKVSDENVQHLLEPDARAFADIFSNGNDGNGMFGDHDEVNDAFRDELEKLFSMGVRGLLTTYMQRALQPAIKETLMENMGYTISYG
ncbi:uncharacterized protein LOC106091928 isoform X1 [Stomoxys calcitrans]|uniref:uncharacterized protein LOC106091928 isoform X1 n=2 Tax=Stomoxys calcitrans TaxID=35570 RepID=UPI0027E3B005|nr:uncharacterized protein LOC106091928 isoform X1 [Stomoxys calcitrans]